MEIKTLNEQIERVRELIRKCYATVAGKNGTVPEVRERNMENLPAAIESVPSPVKVKVSTLKVNAACIGDDGKWAGAQQVDVSACTTLADCFFSNSKLAELDLTGWDVSNVTSLSNFLYDCINCKKIDLTGWDVSNVTNFNKVFYAHTKNSRTLIGYEDWDVSKGTTFAGMFGGGQTYLMKYWDFRKWDVSKATKISSFFPTYITIKSLVGGESIDSVIANNTTILKGFNVSYNTGDRFYCYDRASLRAWINGLADLTGADSKTLTINSDKADGVHNTFDTLTEEDIAVAVAKNWTIAKL